MADLIDIKKVSERKKKEEDERKKRNERVKRNMQKEEEVDHTGTEEYTEYFDEDSGNFSPGKVWKNRSIPGLKDLGSINYYWDGEWTEFHDIVQDFFNETEEKYDQIKKDKGLLDKIMNKYIKQHPDWNLKDALKDAYESGGANISEMATITFYQLPSDQFGNANVGPSKNILNPDETDINDAINDILNQPLENNWLVIYSDDPFKYKKIINTLRREEENNN
jgi:hypothetical protein